MTKISLLGALHIPFLVWQWNESTDTEVKKYIREMTMSGGTLKMQTGLEKIFEVFNKGAAERDFIVNIGHLDDFILRPLLGPVDEEHESLRAEKARSDVGFYFLSMFRLGHFEQMPMPEFGYEMPAIRKSNKAEPLEVDMEAMQHQRLSSCSPEKLLQGATEMAAEHHMPRPAEEIRFGPRRDLSPEAQQDT